LVPAYAYDDAQVFRSDSPPEEVAARRRAGFLRLSGLYRERYAKTLRLTADARAAISDLQFTGLYRVPFQYAAFVRRHLGAGAFVESSSGKLVTDLDGNQLYDLIGSYGVNLLGYEFYKECLERAHRRVKDLGPVLGPYHPVVADNVKRLQAISGLDQVSFH